MHYEGNRKALVTTENNEQKQKTTYKKHTHTHTHNRFTALLEFVWDHPGEQVPER